MSESEMNSYRLTSMEEPGDERMAQIMREVAEDARESTRRAAARVAAGIEAATHKARARVEETLNKLHNVERYVDELPNWASTILPGQVI